MLVSPSFEFTRVYKQPYHHAWIPGLFPGNCNDDILYWLDDNLSWNYTQTDFYEQYEFSLRDVKPPKAIQYISCESTLDALGKWISKAFHAPSLVSVDVVAHCLQPGHKIGIHNDHLPNGETHRLLLHFCQNVEGGESMLFENGNPQSLQKVIKPVHGTAFAFEISPVSFHAVGRVQKGRRYTLVYSFQQGE